MTLLFGIGVGFLILAAGLLLFFLGLLDVHDRRLIENTPTSRCRSIALGPVEVSGRVTGSKPLPSLISRIPCFYSRVVVRQFRRRGRSESWVTVNQSEIKLPFMVDDGTGTIEVEGRGGDFRLTPDVNYSTEDGAGEWNQRSLDRSLESGETRPFEELLREFCSIRNISLDAPTRCTETNLCSGDPVYVLGTATEAEGATERRHTVIRSSLRFPLLIAETGEEQIVKGIGNRGFLRLVAGTVVGVVGVTWLLASNAASQEAAQGRTTLTLSDIVQQGAPYLQQAMAIAIPLFTVVGAVAYLVIIYNGLVSLRNEAERAWANIDVLLKQRIDLLPNLVEVCKAYMQHEREVLSSIAEARSGWMAAGDVAHKLQAAQAAGSALKSLFAVVENYPNLRANENFAQLQRSIFQLETQIADRRELYNASVGAFNTRIAEVPDVWIARLFGYAAKPYFAIGDSMAGKVSGLVTSSGS